MAPWLGLCASLLWTGWAQRKILTDRTILDFVDGRWIIDGESLDQGVSGGLASMIQYYYYDYDEEKGRLDYRCTDSCGASTALQTEESRRCDGA